MKHEFRTKGELWKYSSDKASWFFVTIDLELSEKIKHLCDPSSAWGQIPCEVTTGKTTWKTSLFPEKKGTFIICIKKSVRQAEGIEEGDMVKLKFRA